MKMLKYSIPMVLLVAAILAYSSFYIVDEKSQAIILQFGRIVGDGVTEPGLHFKKPFIQNPMIYPKNLLEWDGNKGEIPTKNKTYIWVDTFARWKITDPIAFYKTMKTVELSQFRMTNIIDSSVKNAIASFPLIESVRNQNRKIQALNLVGGGDYAKIDYDVEIGREEITDIIMKQAAPKLLDFGITLVDFKIKRINYREDVRTSVFDRMIAEREQVVERFRSEGKGEAEKIRGQKEKELKEIQSVAYRKAQEVKGKADAEATRIFAEAYSKDPEFYSFVKTLDVYKETVGKDSSLVLSTESEFLKFLKSRE